MGRLLLSVAGNISRLETKDSMIRKSRSSGTLAAAVVVAVAALIIQLQAPAQGPGSEPGPVAPAADDGSVAPGGYIPSSANRNRDDVVWLAPFVDHEISEGGAYTASSGGNVPTGKPAATILPGTYETRFANPAGGCGFTIRTYEDDGSTRARSDEYFMFHANISSAFSIESGQAIFFHASDVGKSFANGECPLEWIRLGEPGLVNFGIDLPDVADVEYDEDHDGHRNFPTETLKPGWWRSVGEVGRNDRCAVTVERRGVPNLGDPKLIHTFWAQDVDEMFFYVPPHFDNAPRNLLGIDEGLYEVNTDHTRCPPFWQPQLG